MEDSKKSQTKQLKNPFLHNPDYNCFGCNPNNKSGLHLHFKEEGEWVTAVWQPQSDFEGYPNILHGGIQASLLDEIGAWAVYVKMQTSGVTSRITVKYKKAVLCNTGKIRVRGRILEVKRNICFIHAELLNSSSEICAEAEIQYFLYSKELSVKEYLFPQSIDDFYAD